MSRPIVKQLDVVTLARGVGGWPPGTVGTIVESHHSAALVEISDEQGRTLDFVTVPCELLRPAPAAG